MIQVFVLLFAATASSTLDASRSASYGADNAFDGNPETAWCEGVDGDGVGEWLLVDLGEAAALGSLAGLRVEVFTGYQKNAQTYHANGRPTRLRVVLLAADKVAARTALSCGQESRCSGAVPVAGPLAGPVRLRLTVDKVEPGAKFHDTCVSEVLPSLPRGAVVQEAREVAARFCWAALKKDAAALRELTDEPLDKVRAALRPEVGDADAPPTCKADQVTVRAADAFDLYQREYGGGGASYRRFVRVAGRWRARPSASYYLSP